MVRLENVTDLETARQMAALLKAENARLHQRLEWLVQENARIKGEDAQARLQLEPTQLKEQVALMQQRLFGASSEKRPSAAEATPPSNSTRALPSGPLRRSFIDAGRAPRRARLPFSPRGAMHV